MTLKKQILTLVILPMALSAATAHAGFERVEERGPQQGRQGGYGIGEGNQDHGGFGHGGGEHGGGHHGGGRHGGGKHGPGPGHGGGWGPRPPMPPPPPPPHGGGGWQPIPPRPTPYPGNGGAMYQQVVVPVNSRIIQNYYPLYYNSAVRNYYGYMVQSVTVYARGGTPYTQVSLVVNRQFESSSYAPMGAFTLIPQGPAVVGQMSDLQLLVRGLADIDYVVVNLVRVGGRF